MRCRGMLAMEVSILRAVGEAPAREVEGAEATAALRLVEVEVTNFLATVAAS